MDLNFVKRLSGVGFFSCTIAGTDGLAGPTSYNVCRIVWDLGGADERVWFEGIITEVRRKDGTNMRTFKGLSAEGILWMAQVGGVRTFKAATPYAIAQGGAGPPADLLRNMQGSVAMAYGTSASVPNKVDGVNPGLAMSFRTDSGSLFVNFQRLAMQAQYNNTDPTVALRYGLELFVRFEGANNSTPTFYLVRRREQSPSPAETFTVNTDFFKPRRGFEGITGAQALRVIGSKSGIDQTRSAIIGAGGIEGIVSEKTVIGLANAAGNTNADVMVNRLVELMNPATEVVTGYTHRYAFDSDPGDTVTVAESGIANANLRIFSIAYRLQAKLFSLTLGRPRVLEEDGWIKLSTFTGGHGTGTQIMAPFAVNAGQPIGSGLHAVGAGAYSPYTTLNFTARDFDRDFDEALTLLWQVNVDQPGNYDVQIDVGPGAGTIVHDMGYALRAGHTYVGTAYVVGEIFASALGPAGFARLRLFNNNAGGCNVTAQQLSAWVQS